MPMYFLIGMWGGTTRDPANSGPRIYAAVKFFVYTMAGSVLMLAAMTLPL